MAEPIGKIVLAQMLFEDDARIEAIAEKAWIKQQYFDKLRGRGRITENLAVRRYHTKSGNKPEGLEPVTLNNGLVMDTYIYLARRRFLVGFSEDLQLLGYIEVAYSEG